MSQDSLNTRSELKVGDKTYDLFSLPKAAQALGDISRLPFSLKILLENLLRFEDGKSVKRADLQALVDWQKTGSNPREIAFRPARVLMQDFTGVPAVVDLAAMRQAVRALGGDPKVINPLSPVDLVIDHSLMVDEFGLPSSFEANVQQEFKRNRERYEFLRWGQSAFDNFSVVPPGTGICHQVNLENLAKTVWTKSEGGRTLAYPDTLVGTDSHTTMINALSVLGWGVGGIEAEAAMLGQPVSMLIPEVIGFEIKGRLREGTTATDLVLRVVEMLRAKGVVGKFVEFYGEGLTSLPLADRATIANMAPEYGATVGFFPIDAETIRYLRFTGREEATVQLVEAYAKAQGLWREDGQPAPRFTDSLSLDLDLVQPALAGPKRPQDRVLLSQAHDAYLEHLAADLTAKPQAGDGRQAVQGEDYSLDNGDVVIAAITSCTNTSNPSVMIAAGLVAQKANALGLVSQPWVKTSLAPGSQVVSDYLEKAGLQTHLDAIGFDLVGYGCTTCIGNSGPLQPEIESAITAGDVRVAAVLSGNRNFEGRVHPLSRFNYLASPPLVVAYALKGTMAGDIFNDPLTRTPAGEPVYLSDLWPSQAEVDAALAKALEPEMFSRRYADVFKGTADWQQIKVSGGLTYDWDAGSSYVQYPPFFTDMGMEAEATGDIHDARPLLILGDSVTTDHISPAGAIKRDAPAGLYLRERQVSPEAFNSYGARRGNHEVMMRGTFANIRIRNHMLDGQEGGFTKHYPSGEVMDIYAAAMRYAEEDKPLIVIAGQEYGTGSSRDWAAKGTRLLGVKAVIAQSFERIHRSNLVGMGVLPLQFQGEDSAASLALTGAETFSITGLSGDIQPRMSLPMEIRYPDGTARSVTLLCRIDTANEVDYYRNGGILHYVLRDLMRKNQAA